jgi:hypothetical protein
MQTILKVMCDDMGQASMVESYISQFHAKAAKDPQSIEFPSLEGDDVAFARDDANEFRDNCTEQPRAQLGSFGPSPNLADSNTQFIFMNPIILSYRPNGSSLRLWVSSPSPGTTQSAETE